MNENESKARLIVKRIVADLAGDQSTPLSCEWESLNPATREEWVSIWTEIVKGVLGEKEEPLSDEAMLQLVCKRIQPSAVMLYAYQRWVERKGVEACTIGPSRGLLIECGCEGPTECEWCCGTNKLTRRVKQAKEEAERPKEKKHEEFGGDPDVWNNHLFHSGWTEGFIQNMRELGARKIEVPASRKGSFVVEFDRGKPPPTPDPGPGEKVEP